MKVPEENPIPQPEEAVPEQAPEQAPETEVEQAPEQAPEPEPEQAPEAEALREAYLRGRNEAIAEALGRDAEHPFDAPRNHTPGIQDPYTPPSDPALAAVFTFRQSVWG